MRKLLFLPIAMLLLGRLEAADACTSRRASYDQLLAKASTVFIGRIIRTQEAGTSQEHSASLSPRSSNRIDGRRRETNMRKLPCLILALLLLGRLETAAACSMLNPPTDAELFAKASTVFVARIIRTEEIEMPYPASRWGSGVAGPGVEATFRLIEVLKGQPPADGKVRGPIPFICMMPLMAAVDYVIFLNEGDNVIVWALDKGTRPLPSDLQKLSAPTPASDPLCQRRECVLGKLRELGKGQ